MHTFPNTASKRYSQVSVSPVQLLLVMHLKVSTGEEGIISTQCECPQGDYKCSHAAALAIFAVHNISRTDTATQWKKPKAAKRTHHVEELFPPLSKSYNPLTREPTAKDRAWLRNRLSSRFSGFSWLLSPEPEEEPYTLATLSVSKIVESVATGQHNNPKWHLLRKGRLTASNFGAVLKAKRVTASLLARVMGEQQALDGVLSIQWGTMNEKEGIKAFTTAIQMPVEESGLWLSRSGVLGASPGGLVGSSAVLEVKCPYGTREMTITEALAIKGFCVSKEGDSYHLRDDHPYWHQVQGQLHLTGRQTCYFVVWTTKDTAIIPIARDESWQPKLVHLEDFFKAHMLPKLAPQ
ncbi:uncharacterized protein LOC125878853 [Epinephelus fuscoguttatus]|uniref:uncharacterized protein LOC125878853 n=1 Tax=Epinephelus fuscoguttatus TaxID=293821 RepID=UPI0020D00DCC|nr:uncharacterized protein LOC125878853 [Epinephelus fuscoguttatus]XP_049416268.1 uncharacterized protein LOC125878853 [Epinephelus fuscoguttatus]